ncbi:pseudouridine synthase [Spongiactinospora sp. TRM90649]|uniref:pseudouridine synthase n=1 Tax=Spongiactinospora sp. TRM90649 TaxID=3031114 RepID=UPI0023F9FB69|nr:pseudouridine synthase [Spongiactinospora sp. TRM90649]MDF5755925.1 pseudouridine synthase [Spongiactinospora sp. TRM90649]
MNDRRTPSGDGRGRRSGARGGPGSGGDAGRGSFRASRGGSRDGYGTPYSGRRESDRGTRSSGPRGPRQDPRDTPRDDRRSQGGYGSRDDRRPSDDRRSSGGYGSRDDRRSSGGYGSHDDRRPARSSGPRDDFRPRDDRRSSGGYGSRDDRRSSGGYGSRDDQRSSGGYGSRDDRRPARSSGPRDDYRPRDDHRQRDDRRSSGGYGSRDDRPRGGWGSRDEVRTIGGRPEGSRSRFGRPGGEGRERPVRGERSGRPDSAARADRRGRPERPAQRSYERPSDRRPERASGEGFKSAQQPIRDRALFPDGYTDERDTTEVPDGTRLQKVLAQAGVASRRACEEMIGEGRVTVDGQVVRRFGARVDPAKQIIHVDGKRVPTAPDLVYFAINKPIGVVSTMSDPEGRPSLADYVVDRQERLFHVGRLDTETEGLILLTNDGELANRLTHPSYGVRKKYWAKVNGTIERGLGRILRDGVELEDGIAKADDFKIVQEHGQQALVEIVLHEGRKHIVRRMLAEVGHSVIDLARIEFGPVKMGRLKSGTLRALTLTEIGELYAAVGL